MKKSNIYLPFSISYYSPNSPELTVLYICYFHFCWIRIHADPQHCLYVCKKPYYLTFLIPVPVQYAKNVATTAVPVLVQHAKNVATTAVPVQYAKNVATTAVPVR